jgi:hypothetical protein
MDEEVMLEQPSTAERVVVRDGMREVVVEAEAPTPIGQGDFQSSTSFVELSAWRFFFWHSFPRWRVQVG